MKKLIFVYCVLFAAGQLFAQTRPLNQEPDILIPVSHKATMKAARKNLPEKSFYKSKTDWQTIIDTTWGPGLPLADKLKIFDSYADSLTRKFDGFNSLGIDLAEWEAIKKSYRTRINTSTSRGAFSSLMSHFAYNLQDGHTYAWDDSVARTPLNPGTPVLVSNGFYGHHFGAVLTTLPDSSLVVLRTLENHPLGLEPGDLVLGYEGVLWKDLFDELIQADIPILFDQAGARSAIRHRQLVSAGNNWHLFDTIDIVKYASGDTLHLPVYPLLDLPKPVGNYFCFCNDEKKNLFLNNEQLPIPGVPFPDPNKIDEQAVYYGIIEGTNIGYIYIMMDFSIALGDNYSTDAQFYNAITALWNTEGLIIDIRSEPGGFPYPLNAYGLLFNKQFYTLQWNYRCNTEDFTLCPDYDLDLDYLSNIQGIPISLFDRPIGILMGANCQSGGEIRANMLSYHPMSLFFGKSSSASMGFNEAILNIPDWTINYSMRDVNRISQPNVFLNHKEFPIDDTTWFDRNGIANGEDAVVNKAIEWIQNLAYAHDIQLSSGYVPPGSTDLKLSTIVENPDNHDLLVHASISSNNEVLEDSILLAPAIDRWETLLSVPENEAFCQLSITTDDLTEGSSRTLPDIVRYTTAGPLEYENTLTGTDTIPNPGDRITFKIALHNQGIETSIPGVMATLTSLDEQAVMSISSKDFPDIAPGESALHAGNYALNISGTCPAGTAIPIKIDIASNGYVFWIDTLYILVQPPLGLEQLTEPLIRIYPNPVNDKLNVEISYTGSQHVQLELYTVAGNIIYRKSETGSGYFKDEIDVSGITPGLYFLRIEQEGGVYTKKVVIR